MIAELTAVKGIGMWSAQMFLMFHLERPDVLPTGDLGIRRAIERAYEPGRDCRTRSAMEEIAAAVAPAPHAGLPVPVALAGERAGIGLR